MVLFGQVLLVFISNDFFAFSLVLINGKAIKARLMSFGDSCFFGLSFPAVRESLAFCSAC